MRSIWLSSDVPTCRCAIPADADDARRLPQTTYGKSQFYYNGVRIKKNGYAFLLRGEVLSSNRVVAWDIFPIAGGQFDIIEGKFRCPMLHGEMDHRVEKHKKLKFLITSYLNRWMCNLYFEIIKLPGFLAEKKEYEVELPFLSRILSRSCQY